MSTKDHADIKQAALDYIEGFYDGDAARMERSPSPGSPARRPPAPRSSPRPGSLHLSRFNGRWVIVNVLWEMKPGQPFVAYW